MSKEQQAALCLPRVRRHLPQIILLLFVIQPFMDIVSYWLTVTGGGTTVSLLLRFGVLFATALLGFALSRNRKAYLLLAGAVVLLAAGHIAACAAFGYADPVYDLTNYIRVVQIPLFAFCFITFLRESGEEGYRAIECGFVINFVIIVAVEALSAVTGTNPYTYPNKSLGLLGWFYFANSQSAILSAIVPVLLMQAIRKKNVWLLIGGTAVSFGVLYLFATRLAYFAIFVCAIGLAAVQLLARCADRRAIAVLVVGAVLCGAGLSASPMARNQAMQREIAQQKQLEVDQTIAQREAQYGTTVEEQPEVCLLPVYEEYLGGMVERFGAQRVMQHYEYTSDVTRLKDWREMKLTFCSFLMEDAGTPARLFGLELADMIQDGETYDVENDFHGIYFLYGTVGLAAFVLFLLYFAVLIVRALVRSFSRYMTQEAGAFGVSLCLLLAHVYATAGVLRRPNASFYLSVVLAVIYYFVKIRTYGGQPRE